MRSATTCRNALAATLLLAALHGAPLRAETLNFSAVLTPGTCAFSLDKSTLALGYVPLSHIAPSTLVAAQPFTLTVSDCGGGTHMKTPAVKVSGAGITQDGKWLFRDTSFPSASVGVGIMLVKTDVPPVYAQAEVKNDATFPLDTSGSAPEDHRMTFYAGLTCGSAATCASAKAGKVTARITFSLDFI